MHPLLILLLGTVVVIFCIIKLRIGAFFGLMLAALLVSFLAPGEMGDKITRVITALGGTAGKISLIIACAAVIGKCMMDSGAADRIVRAFLNLLGEKHSPIALMSSGFVLSVPVFFDTVFYLLVPLARSLHEKTKKNYLLYILAIGGGAAITHTLVPPTPGPLAMAENLGFDVGIMIIVGIAVSMPCAIAALLYAGWVQKRLDIPMRPIAGGSDELAKSEPAKDDAQLPGLFPSLLPIILPVLLISTNTVVSTLSKSAAEGSILLKISPYTALFGNSNLALLLSAAFALLLWVNHCRPSREQIGQGIESAMMSAGVIILITAAGGAFGAMLKAAGVGPVIQEMFTGGGSSSAYALIFIGWVTACLLKISQGSSTVAMITTSSIMAAMITPETLTMHPVYLATAIGCGSLCGSWMNDSGFWIVAKMSGLTEVEALKTWTIALVILSVTGLLITLLLATALPMRIPFGD